MNSGDLVVELLRKELKLRYFGGSAWLIWNINKNQR